MSDGTDTHRQALTLLTGQVQVLNERLAESSRRTAELAARNETLGKRSKHHSWWILATITGLVADMVLSVVMVTTASRLSTTVAALKATQVQLQETDVRQEVARSQVLCPFFALVVGAYNPESRPAGQPRQQYEDAYAQMRNSYRVLQCSIPVVPPASPH